MPNIADNISEVKENLPNVTPTPPGIKAQVSPQELKARLEWGEPGLTILDVRDREAFNYERITGAMTMPMDRIANTKPGETFEDRRDIYVYGESDDQTAQIANTLRSSGFLNVAEIKGGLPAWKAIGGPTEGIASMEGPSGPSSVKKPESNVAARLNQEQKLDTKRPVK